MALNSKPLIIWDNVFLLGIPTATDTDADTAYSVLNIRDRRSYTFWKAASPGTKNLSVDTLTAHSADCIGIVGHNLFSAAASVAVHSSSNGTDWTTRLAAFNPSDDHALVKQFTTASARYWRVQIITATVAPFVAVISLGTAMSMEKYPDSGYDPSNEAPVTLAATSDTGNLLGTIITFTRLSIKPAFHNLTPAWVAATFKPVWEAHLSQYYPFFWVWDITNHPTEVYYVRIKPGYKLSLPYDPVRQSLTLDLEGVKE